MALALDQIKHSEEGRTPQLLTQQRLEQEDALETLLAFLSADPEEKFRYVTDLQLLSDIDPESRNLFKASWWKGTMRLQTRMVAMESGSFQITLLIAGRPLIEGALVRTGASFKVLPSSLRLFESTTLDEWLLDAKQAHGGFRVYIEEGAHLPEQLDERRYKSLTLVDVFSNAHCTAIIPRYSHLAADLDHLISEHGNGLQPPSHLSHVKEGIVITSPKLTPELGQERPNREASKDRLEAYVRLTKEHSRNNRHHIAIRSFH